MRMYSAFIGYLKESHTNRWAVFFFLIYIILVFKIITIREFDESVFFASYSILVAVYILSRFLLAYFYSPEVEINKSYRPFITVITPAKDEEDNISMTLRAIINSDYPKSKFEVIAINDGSADGTLAEMNKVKQEAFQREIAMKVIDWKTNRGKRHGMAEGARLAKGEILFFVDSDSFIAPSALRETVKYFNDPSVGALSGHADVYNADENMLTKMQAVRYYVAFRVYKSAEALFGSVTCCSGCSSAYRKEYVMKILDRWENQQFLGGACTYGDDRSLTNYLLKDWKAVYAFEVKAETVVPDTWKKFFKQQLRWKKSWTRESLRASLFMWQKNPIMMVSFFLGVILPLLAPIIVFRALLWMPLMSEVWPWFYILGLFLMASVYGLYYYIYTHDRLWVYGVLFALIYSFFLVWQLPYAILNIRDSRWGTR